MKPIHSMCGRKSKRRRRGHGGGRRDARVLGGGRTAPLCSCQILSDVALRGKGSHFLSNAQVISGLSSSRL